MNNPKRALMIQLRRIGDVLMCTPAIRAFKERFPDCRLDFLTEFPDVLSGNPHLNEIIRLDSLRQYDPLYQYSLIRSIRNSRYDMIIDFHANPRSAYYSFFSGAAVRLSYGYGHRRWAYNLIPHRSNESVYAARDRLNLLGAIEIRAGDCGLEFYPSDNDRKEASEMLAGIIGPVATISPVSRKPAKRWPLERFAELAEKLAERFDYQVVILTGPGEEIVASELRRLIESAAPRIFGIGRLGLLGSIFERAEIHIGNDNGPKHIAVACGAPTFTIYGPPDPLSWTYPDKKRHGFITPSDVDSGCRAAGHISGDKCILKIPVEAVMEIAAPLIYSIRAGKSSVKTP